VALATLRIDLFENVYDELNLGEGGTVLLAFEDGSLLYRRAGEAAAARQHEEELRRQRAAEAAAEAVQAEEIERQRLLLVEATKWRDAEVIRAYVAHIKKYGNAIAPALDEWLVWASTAADNLDPTWKRLK
jgi:hypothetical protein